MKIASFLFTLFITITFASLFADNEKQVRAKPQEVTIKPIDRNAETIKAMLNGSAALTFCAAGCYSLLRATGHFFPPKQKAADPFFGLLNIFMALTMLELAYKKGSSCFEALRKSFVGYDLQYQRQPRK